MARALRIEYSGAYYHVTSRGNERRPIFKDPADRQTFLARLQIALENYQVRLHAYVLMDNHFHFVLQTPQGNLSEFMRQFNVAYTGYYNRRHHRVGHLYQGRFKAIVIEAESYLLEVSRYVHLNPVRVMRRKGQSLKEKSRYLRNYDWSSLGGYLRSRNRKPFVRYKEVLAYFGGDHERGRKGYARFIEEGIREVESPWEKVTGQVLLGGDRFVEKMRDRLSGDKTPRREQPSRRSLARRWRPEEVIQQVAKIWGREEKELCARGAGIERAILMELLHRYAQESQREIGLRMGGVDYTWVSRMRSGLRSEIAKGGGAKRLFQKAEAALTQE